MDDINNKDVIPQKDDIMLSPVPGFFTKTEDTTDRAVERAARGYIMGTEKIGRARKIKNTMHEQVTKRIGRKGKYLVDKLFELAEGVYVVDKIASKAEGTEVRYYKTPPQLNAITYLLDRVMGKPTQHTEHTEEKKGILLVEHIIRNLAEGHGEDTRRTVGTGGNIGGGQGFPPVEGGEVSATGLNLRAGEKPL